MPFQRFDPKRLRLLPLAERIHDLDRSVMIRPEAASAEFAHPAIPVLAQRITAAASAGRSVIFCCGAHVIRKGIGPLLIDLMERRLLSHLALNGAGAIHDFELAMIGKTCESVARYVQEGQFGLWQETGRFNDAAATAACDGLGLGEGLGRAIMQGDFPYRASSVLAAGYRLQVPVTVHVALGQDIVHEHPNFDPGATAEASYADFLIYAASVDRLEGGVFVNAGSAVMGPEVYLKALAMARNVAHQEGRSIRRFTTAVFDLVGLGDELQHEAPKDDARYYFRPFKTILVRTVADGGESFYVRGEHDRTLPALYKSIRECAG